MLVVRVELHSAITGEVTEIARAHIANVSAMQSDTFGDYRCDTLRGRSRQQLDRGVKQHTGRVTCFPRKQHHVWHLVVRALASCGYGAPNAAQTIEVENARLDNTACAVPPGTAGGGPAAVGHGA